MKYARVDGGSVTTGSVTSDGLAGNTNLFALTGVDLPPVAGSPSQWVGSTGGGYEIAYTPVGSDCPDQNPQNSNSVACPTLVNTSPEVAETVTANVPAFTGTKPIDVDIQWQGCTSASNANTCTDLAGETGTTYIVDPSVGPPPGQQKFLRVKMTASNGAPTFGRLVRYSKVTNAVTSSSGYPGSNDADPPTIVNQSGPTSTPKVGDTLFAADGSAGPAPGWFNPAATTTTFQWLRCSEAALASCVPIAGATSRSYVTQVPDGGDALGVRVTGKAGSSGRVLTSNLSDPVEPKPATPVEVPSLIGTAQAGQTLAGSVGAWEDPTTGFRRSWLRCDASGGSCAPLGADGATYAVQAADVGSTLRLRVTADVEGDITDGLDQAKPDAVSVDSAPTSVVDAAPIPPGIPGPNGGSRPSGVTPDLVKPLITKLSVTNKKFVVAAGATAVTARSPKGTAFRFTLSEVSTAVITIEQLQPGRKVGKKCVKPTRKNRKRRKCTRATKRGTLTRRFLKAGANSVKFSGRIGKKKLPGGSYQATVVATDAAGNASKPAKTKFSIVRR